MNTSIIRCLDLRTALLYGIQENLEPFSTSDAEECLFCFEINDGASFEPDAGHYLGRLLQKGCIQEEAVQEEVFSLQAGIYLFLQLNRYLDREACTEAAVELQKEGLWQAKKMENILYIRYLKENGSIVTQLLRPVLSEAPAAGSAESGT